MAARMNHGEGEGEGEVEREQNRGKVAPKEDGKHEQEKLISPWGRLPTHRPPLQIQTVKSTRCRIPWGEHEAQLRQ
jgi:hypothetical protein